MTRLASNLRRPSCFKPLESPISLTIQLKSSTVYFNSIGPSTLTNDRPMKTRFLYHSSRPSLTRVILYSEWIEISWDFWSLLNMMNLTKLILFELNSFMFYSEKKVPNQILWSGHYHFKLFEPTFSPIFPILDCYQFYTVR